MRILLKITIFLAVLFGTTRAIQAQESVIPPDLDKYVDTVLESFQVPGMSIGIVKNGKIVLAKGYGIKKLNDPSPVDENTLFSIASNSKAFTATAMAILVEKGKLKWEDKVIQYLPWFEMSDAYVTAQLTIRDLFVHHSGLKSYANDILLFPPSTFTRKELLMKLKNVKLPYDFRSVYAYDNILYLAAGEIIEKVSGIPWEGFVQKNIFDTIGMDRSLSRFSSLRGQSNVAYAHAIRNGELQVIDSFFDQNIGDASNPAGGIASSAMDMSKWLITQLDSGRTPDQKRIFSPKATRELWRIIVPIPISKEPEKYKPAQRNFNGYGLGFRVHDYRGHKIVAHTGSLTGFVSQVTMVPELDLGIVVLTNQLATGAYLSIANHILDFNMNAEPFDWLAGYKSDWDKSAARRDSIQESRKMLLPDKRLPLSLSLEKYAGKYKDELMGGVVISYSDKGLHMQFDKSPFFDADLEHYHGDLFRAHYINSNRGEGPFLYFSLNPDLTIREAKFISSFSNASRNLEGLTLKPDKK